MLEEFLNTLDNVSVWMMMATTATLTILSARQTKKHRETQLFYLLTGAYACLFLGDLFTVLHYMIAGNYPYIFSSADLSNIGMYCFLIAIELSLMDTLTDEQRQIKLKYRRAVLIGPAVVILFHIAYIVIYPDILISNILYCIPLSFLSYYSLLMFLSSRKTRGAGRLHCEPLARATGEKPSMYAYHRGILLFLIVELLLFLVSSFGWWPVSSVMWLMLEVPVIMIFVTANRGWDCDLY